MALNRTEVNTKRPVPFVCLFSDLEISTREFNDTITTCILVATGLMVSFLAIFFNVLVILAVKKEKKLQNHSNLMLASLAVVDLLTGAVSLPLFTAEMLIGYQVPVEYICMLDLVDVPLMSCFSLASIQHLTVIAWERYVAVRMWKDYKAIVTKGRIKKLAIAAWLLAILMVVPLYIMVAIGVDQNAEEKWYIVLTVWVAFCFIMICYFYSMIYFKIREHGKRTIHQVNALIKVKLASNVAKMTGMATAALIVSFVPSCIIHAGLKDVFPELRLSLASGVSQLLLHCNSVANPLIYCYTNRSYRNAFLGLLKIRNPQHTQPNVRFFREKNPPNSLGEVVDLKVNQRQRNRLARSASFDTALVLDFASREPRGLQLKRSPTTSYRAKRSGSCGNLQVKQHSSIIKTTALIHGERGGRCRTK